MNQWELVSILATVILTYCLLSQKRVTTGFIMWFLTQCLKGKLTQNFIKIKCNNPDGSSYVAEEEPTPTCFQLSTLFKSGWNISKEKWPTFFIFDHFFVYIFYLFLFLRYKKMKYIYIHLKLFCIENSQKLVFKNEWDVLDYTIWKKKLHKKWQRNNSMY